MTISDLINVTKHLNPETTELFFADSSKEIIKANYCDSLVYGNQHEMNTGIFIAKKELSK